jgi:hypothetical protein
VNKIDFALQLPSENPIYIEFNEHKIPLGPPLKKGEELAQLPRFEKK